LVEQLSETALAFLGRLLAVAFAAGAALGVAVAALVAVIV
jgi:hypothetical protein